jgi:serine/threonine-protein kinase
VTLSPELLARFRASLADTYQIGEEIGSGGMATVYEARDLRHDRVVALKVLHPIMGPGSELPRRFLQEIRIASRLVHPHILPVHDSGERDGFLWFAMPYLGCESLRDRITRLGRLPIDEALRITAAIASALDYAHRQEVVHRDVKPENVLLADGHPVVADFGIARAFGGRAGRAENTPITGAGMVMGTPAYMSPEQAAGDEVDGRSDRTACMSRLRNAGGEPAIFGRLDARDTGASHQRGTGAPGDDTRDGAARRRVGHPQGAGQGTRGALCDRDRVRRGAHARRAGARARRGGQPRARRPRHRCASLRQREYGPG